MAGLFLVWQTGLSTDATAQKVNAHQLNTVATTKMALPGLLHINFDSRYIGWQ
jgi:hypothetical protein